MTEEHNALPRATIAAVPFARDEPATDRAFLCAEDGRTYRVRRARLDQPVRGIALFRREYRLTITALGLDGRPERDGNGDVVIIAATNWIVDAQTMQPGGLSLDQQQDLVVANLVHQALPVAIASPALDAMDADWVALQPSPAPGSGEAEEPE